MEKRMLGAAFIGITVLLSIVLYSNNNVKTQVCPRLTTWEKPFFFLHSDDVISQTSQEHQALLLSTPELSWQALQDTYAIDFFRPDLHTPMMAIELTQTSVFYLAHEGDEVTLPLPNAKPLSIKVTHVEYLSDDIRQWAAAGNDAKSSAMAVMTVQDDWLKGFIGTPNASYSITLLNGQGWIYQEMNASLGDDQAYPNNF